MKNLFNMSCVNNVYETTETIQQTKPIETTEQIESNECNICLGDGFGGVGIKHHDVDRECPFEACAPCASLLQKTNFHHDTRCTCGIKHDMKLIFTPKKSKYSNITCFHCNAICKDDASYREHIFRKCRNISHMCMYCDSSIEGLSLDNHEKKYCAYSYPCKKCNTLIFHKDRVRHGKYACFPVKCTKHDCHKKFRNKWDRDIHLTKDHFRKCSCCEESHDDEIPLAQCTKCKKFYCSENFSDHVCIK